MNNLVEASDERFIRVFRGEEQLTSGSIYHHSESLTVSISDAHNQFVYEAIGGAIFDRGGCDGKRVANKPQAILKMPTSGDETISIVAGLCCIVMIKTHQSPPDHHDVFVVFPPHQQFP